MTHHRFDAYHPETRALLEQYRAAPDPELIAPLLDGISRYYLPEDAGLDKSATTEERYAFAAQDSLTLMEIILDVQDAFELRIPDSDLREVTSFTTFLALIRQKTGQKS
jgi:acyl carrier protein